MPVIDDRGRLFGTINLIDATFFLLLLLLIPVGYGAYVLFRAPIPTIEALQPTTLPVGKNQTVELRGTNLRPFMRVRIGDSAANAFLLQTPSRGEIKLPELPPGTYDVSLYDETQELTRRAGALTIVAPAAPPPPPTIPVQVRGVFTDLTADESRTLRVGLVFPGEAGVPLAEVRALQPAEPAVQRIRMGPETVISNPIPNKLQVPAILELRCVPASDGCRVGGSVVDRNVTLSLLQPGAARGFFVEEVKSAGSPVAFPPPPPPLPPDAVVRLVGTFSALDAAQVGELKVGTRFLEKGDAVAEVISLQRAEPALQPVRVGPGTVVTPLAGRAQLSGVIRVRCTVVNDGCKVGDTVLARNVTLALTRGGRLYRFSISDVRPMRDPVPAQIRVRFVARPEVRGLIKVGDVDVVAGVDGKDSAARLLAIGETQNLESQVNINLDPEPDPTRRQYSHMVQQQLISFDATVSVPLEEGRLGWQYRGEVVKVGAGFSFENVLYRISGWILDVKLPDRATQATKLSQ